MGKKYLIDTNVISHLFADSLPEEGKKFLKNVIDTDFIISVIVEIEALTHHDLPEKMPLIEDFINLATILPLDNLVVRKTIELRKKHKKLRLGDAIIAATALVFGLSLITNNTRDFVNVKGLSLVDIHKI